MKLIAALVLVGLVACSATTRAVPAPRCGTSCFHYDEPSGLPIAAETADVKTCGCPKKAPCGDCCGPQHCRCNPN